jgi:hypothetical protein
MVEARSPTAAPDGQPTDVALATTVADSLPPDAVAEPAPDDPGPEGLFSSDALSAGR